MNTLQIISESLTENKVEIESLKKRVTSSQQLITNQFVMLTNGLLDRVSELDTIASTGTAGLVQLFTGDSSTVNYVDGVAASQNHNHDSAYLKAVPTASTSTLGAIKVGNFLSATTAGVLSVKTGTTSSTVAAGNHTHSSYLTTTDAKKLYGLPISKFNAASVTLLPNYYHQMTGTTSRTSLTITLSAATDTTRVNEYFVEFYCKNNLMTLSVPSTVKWVNGTPPVMTSGSTYQLSFIQGGDSNYLAICAEFK